MTDEPTTDAPPATPETPGATPTAPQPEAETVAPSAEADATADSQALNAFGLCVTVYSNGSVVITRNS